MKKQFLILAACVSPLTTVLADPLVVELNQKVEYLDNKNKELIGMVQKLEYKLDILEKKYDAFSSDVEMRLSGNSAPPLNTAQSSPSSGPLPLTGAERPQPSILRDPHMPQGPGDPIPVAAVPQQEKPQKKLDPKQQYEHARSLLEQGNYEQAGTEFAAFVQSHPQDAHVPDANYWLGVSYLVRGQYESAAGTFAQVYKEHPQSRKAPDSLIKLAKSLSSLGRNQDACTTLTQLKTTFPGKLESQCQKEWTKLGCQ